MTNITTKTTKKRAATNSVEALRFINGRPARGVEGLITASEAFRRLGVKQGGPVRLQANALGLPLAGLGGRTGGIYLVREQDVEELIAQRALIASAKRDAVKAASTPAPTAPNGSQLELPLPAVPKGPSVDERLDIIEAKINRLLEIWGEK